MRRLEELAHFVSSYGAEENVEEALRLHLFDTVAAIVAGHSSDAGRALQRIFPPSSTDAGVLTDVIIRCGSTRSTEIDDIHMKSCTTPGSVVIPVALTLALHGEQVKENDAVADAIIIGYELMTRFGTALDGPRIVYSGLWPTYLAAAFATAGTAAKVYGLDARRTSHALAIALALPIGPIPRIRSRRPTRWLALGIACQNGVLACLAAKEGFEGDLSLLESDAWLKKTVGRDIRMEEFTSNLGKNFAITQTTLKPCCIAKQAASGLECFSQAIASGLSPEKVRSITVSVPEYYRDMISRAPSADDRLSSISNLAYRIALYSFNRKELFNVDHIADEIPEKTKGSDLASKVSIVTDASLNPDYPDSFPARIRVETVDGETFEGEVKKARGDPERPLSREELESKFRNVTMGKLEDVDSEHFIRTMMSDSKIKESTSAALELVSKLWSRKSNSTP